jgi:hypothetical protein
LVNYSFGAFIAVFQTVLAVARPAGNKALRLVIPANRAGTELPYSRIV